jgi:DNA-binding SARP family transcriptional activator
VQLCGPLEVEIEGRNVELPVGQAALVFAFLAADGQRDAARTDLIQLLWPRDAPRDPQAALSPVLSRLRRALGSDFLHGKERLRLELPAPLLVDVERATVDLDNAREAARSRERGGGGPRGGQGSRGVRKALPARV